MNFEPTNSATVTSTSDASLFVRGPVRPLTKGESDLLFALLDMLPDGGQLQSQVPGSLVQEMNDGKMGSLRFVTNGSDRMHHEAVTAQAIDEDGVPLEISINVDANGHLFELDIWKVDFSPVRHLPTPAQVKRA